jgi:hypothetical protein
LEEVANRRSVPNLISHLHPNSWIFSPFLAIQFIFLKPKSDLDFPKFIIQNPLRIWRISYEEGCSSLQILQKIFYLKIFEHRKVNFRPVEV